MKKTEVPQDDSALRNFTREVCYVKDEDGKYNTALSEGWETKKAALDNAWEAIDERIQWAKTEVKEGRKSPIFYFMEEKIMDITVLKGYTGFFGFQIKRHFKPTVFQKLKDSTLSKYAKAFEISLDELKNYKP
jgi:hypothetical protein